MFTSMHAIFVVASGPKWTLPLDELNLPVRRLQPVKPVTVLLSIRNVAGTWWYGPLIVGRSWSWNSFQSVPTSGAGGRPTDTCGLEQATTGNRARKATVWMRMVIGLNATGAPGHQRHFDAAAESVVRFTRRIPSAARA